MSTTPPNHAYYRSCQGSWRGRLSYKSTVLGLLSLPKWLGLTMDTSMDYDSGAARGEVMHTTQISWLRIPFARTAETITLDDNGRDFTVLGHLVWPTPWRPQLFDGRGRVDETGTRATYALAFSRLLFGAKLRQHVVAEGNRVTVTQEHRWFIGTVQLRR